MNPLEQQLLNDCNRFSVGDISQQELEQKFEYYKEQLGEEKFEEILNPKSSGREINLAEAWVGFEDLERISTEEWQKISPSLRLENEAFIGKFLVARLKVEHVVNQLLFEQMEIVDSKAQRKIERLKFVVRLSLLKTEGKLYAREMGLLYDLNTVRNKLVHDLKFDIDGFMRRELAHQLGQNIKGELRQDVLLSILDNALFYLLLETNALKEKKAKIINDNPALRDVLGQ